MDYGGAPFSPRFTFMGSQELDVMSRPNIFSHSPHGNTNGGWYLTTCPKDVAQCGTDKQARGTGSSANRTAKSSRMQNHFAEFSGPHSWTFSPLDLQARLAGSPDSVLAQNRSREILYRNYSLPSKVNQGSIPSGFLHVGTVPLVGGFSRGSPVSPALAFRCFSALTSFHPHRLFNASMLRAAGIRSLTRHPSNAAPHGEGVGAAIFSSMRVSYSVAGTEEGRRNKEGTAVQTKPRIYACILRYIEITNQSRLYLPGLFTGYFRLAEACSGVGRILTTRRHTLRQNYSLESRRLVKRSEYGAAPECKEVGEGGGGRYPRKNPSTSGIVLHDSYLRKSGIGGEQSNLSATAAPSLDLASRCIVSTKNNLPRQYVLYASASDAGLIPRALRGQSADGLRPHQRNSLAIPLLYTAIFYGRARTWILALCKRGGLCRCATVSAESLMEACYRRQDCTSVQCFARRGEERVDAHVSVAPSAPTILGLRRAKFLQLGGHPKTQISLPRQRSASNLNDRNSLYYWFPWEFNPFRPSVHSCVVLTTPATIQSTTSVHYLKFSKQQATCSPEATRHVFPKAWKRDSSERSSTFTDCVNKRDITRPGSKRHETSCSGGTLNCPRVATNRYHYRGIFLYFKIETVTTAQNRRIWEAAVAQWLASSPPTTAIRARPPGGLAPGFSHVGIVLDDAACRRVFSGHSRFPRPCIPAPLHPRVSFHVVFRDDGYLRVPAGKPVTRRCPTGKTLTCENPGATPSGIEPGSSWWEASFLATAVPDETNEFIISDQRLYLARWDRRTVQLTVLCVGLTTHSNCMPLSPLVDSSLCDSFHVFTARGGAVVTRWTRIREDPGSILGSVILSSAFHGFPKSLQANAEMGSLTKGPWPISSQSFPNPCATCTVHNDLAVDETLINHEHLVYFVLNRVARDCTCHVRFRKDKLEVKHECTEDDFAIGSQFTRHALDDSEPMAHLQGNK
ncbi:hypothetical protein PR048_030725 [Dryococelus australis]|uniref:Uncharacterized protein n=1 Tax=Dryococelus australis TaxID=614101 RepID=A0ABQ9GCE7_9NEOP|nr:hypothetical protein PR048_030725 [Dryococelus australis]